MPYDLYGQYYASRRDAENAETAQMASIDADLAYQKVQELEQKLINQSMQQDYDLQQKVDFLMQKVEELENRLNSIAPQAIGEEKKEESGEQA